MNYLLQYLKAFADLTMEMAPYLLLGFLFAGILYGWFPRKKLYKYLGKPNSASVINAALIGIPLPLCSCGVIPTGISFYNSGASKGSTVSFLISTPQTGVDSLMVTYSLLGLPMAIIKPIIALFTGFFGGFLTNKAEHRDNRKNNLRNGQQSDLKSDPGINLKIDPKTDQRNDLKNQEFKIQGPMVTDQQSEKDNLADAENGAADRSLKGMLRYAFVEFLEDIAKWLVIGLALAALIEVLVPESFFTSYLGNEYLEMLLIMVAAIPLYVCATGSVPIAAMLMLKGLSPGAAIVFLMAGPATNAATMTVIGNVFGRRTLILYIFSIVAGAYMFGILVNEFLPREWFLNPLSELHATGHEHEIIPPWLKIGSSVLLGGLTIYALYNKYLSRFFKSPEPAGNQFKMNTNMDKMEIIVKGMTCNHCKATVENNVTAMEGIDFAEADISTDKVILSGEAIDLEKIGQKVESLGYSFGGRAK